MLFGDAANGTLVYNVEKTGVPGGVVRSPIFKDGAALCRFLTQDDAEGVGSHHMRLHQLA